QLNEHADLIREEEKESALGVVAGFLGSWDGSETGFVRYAVKKDQRASLVYRCLDPAQLTQDLISQTFCTIIMSGTLTPTSMYKDVLGFPENTVERSFPSPFSATNRLVLVVPQTTTKYSQRSPEQFKSIASMCANMLKQIPGHVAIFFPSYALRDAVNEVFSGLCHKTVFCEQPSMSKLEKQEFLDRFIGYKEAVLLGVASGSFGEGIDLPGVLKAVIIVGLPLDRPTLETQELIAFYDAKYGKGWDYGYVLPAISKCLQNAGRCIRTERDRGVIVFLDERYAWPNYFNCIPKDWGAVVTTDYLARIKTFFEQSSLTQ
ncbi:MAG: helicase C-terminal domain-containing protein, partial [Candidatus Woesearchaeota archaeon]|nr:helicase C-terminal domain-containing protein [Candidatus Woesearchaeota archaeon]